MAVEVILMANVQGLGSEGDLVTVSNGYARNFLFPKKLVAPVTETTRRRLEKLRRDREEAYKTELDAAYELASKLGQFSCTISVKVNEEDKMFGSVTSADIAGLMQEQGFQVDKSQVMLEQPIKELGVYDLQVRLHPEVNATVKIWVVEE